MLLLLLLYDFDGVHVYRCRQYAHSPSFPLAGYLRDLTNSWNESFLLCGVLLFLSALANIVGARICKHDANKTSVSVYEANLESGYAIDSKSNDGHNGNYSRRIRYVSTSDGNLLHEMRIVSPKAV